MEATKYVLPKGNLQNSMSINFQKKLQKEWDWFESDNTVFVWSFAWLLAMKAAMFFCMMVYIIYISFLGKPPNAKPSTAHYKSSQPGWSLSDLEWYLAIGWKHHKTTAWQASRCQDHWKQAACTRSVATSDAMAHSTNSTCTSSVADAVADAAHSTKSTNSKSTACIHVDCSSA